MDGVDGGMLVVGRRPSFIDAPVGELPVAALTAARDILNDRFASSSLTADNRGVISKLLGFSKGELHCHHSKRSVGRSDLQAFRVAAGTVDGRVVVAACFRHVAAARRVKHPHFTSLLLLAVDRAEERKGYGSAMVDYIERCSARANSSQLVVRVPHASHWCHHHNSLSLALSHSLALSPSPALGLAD